MAALAGLMVAGLSPAFLASQQASPALPEPSALVLPLGEDRGAAATEQALRRLSTTASVMMIVAHPDDEDGGLLTQLSRGLGARATLYTLTRGEGGQNVMSSDVDDALGLIRTNELLKAGEYYGAKQLWGTQADFGFSKTQEEAFTLWGHDRVLYDAVLAVRQERPQVIVSTFVGAVSDGHGQHQVSGEIAQEVFKAAADPKVFPDQVKNGLQPWQPLAVYSMVPFAQITDKGMFDYATGKWAPARFKNYVTGEWTDGALSTDATISVGDLDPVLGRSYTQIARQGWGEQKTQNGGANPTLSGPAASHYHLWAVTPAASAHDSEPSKASESLFRNRKVAIDTSIAGLAHLAGDAAPPWIAEQLRQIDDSLAEFNRDRRGLENLAAAHRLAPIYRQTSALRDKLASAGLASPANASLVHELDLKIDQFQTALADLLGLDLVAFTTKATNGQAGGPFQGSSADETPRSVTPGEEFFVRVHTASATPEARGMKSWFAFQGSTPWQGAGEPASVPGSATAGVSDEVFKLKVPDDAEPTQPYFIRATDVQPYYDLNHPEWRGRSFAPWPLAAWEEWSFDGLPVRLGRVVQTLERKVGPGGIYEPLVVTPPIGLRLDPGARVLPIDGTPLPIRVTVHSQAAADGTVELKLPAGWRSDPPKAPFHRDSAGDTEALLFSVTPASVQAGSYSLQAVATVSGKTYQGGWQSVGYDGLLPYNRYLPSELKTRKIDLKLAPGLRVAYLMGPGDSIPQAIEGLGLKAHLLTAAEVASADLSAWNVIMIGIRAYTTRPELAANQARLNEFVLRGGALVVGYQGGPFPAPLPITLSRRPEEVVDETAPVKLLEPSNALLAWPNALTPADFDGWVEERGHGFADSWDPGYTALTETADPGQDPQRGGLLIAHPGKGTYIYVSYALHRQLPELVPGSYRLLANLLSAGQHRE